MRGEKIMTKFPFTIPLRVMRCMHTLSMKYKLDIPIFTLWTGLFILVKKVKYIIDRFLPFVAPDS